MRRNRNFLRQIAVLMVGIVMVLGVAQAGFCGQVTATTVNKARAEAALDVNELAALEARASQNPELLEISSGTMWIEDHPWVILVVTVLAAAALLALGGD